MASEKLLCRFSLQSVLISATLLSGTGILLSAILRGKAGIAGIVFAIGVSSLIGLLFGWISTKHTILHGFSLIGIFLITTGILFWINGLSKSREYSK